MNNLETMIPQREIMLPQLPGPMKRYNDWQTSVNERSVYFKGKGKPFYAEFVVFQFGKDIGIQGIRQTSKDEDYSGYGDDVIMFPNGDNLYIDVKYGSKLDPHPQHQWTSKNKLHLHLEPLFVERVASGNREANKNWH